MKTAFILGARVRGVTPGMGEGKLARLTSYEGHGFYGIVTLDDPPRDLIAQEGDLVLDYPISAKDRNKADDRAYQRDRDNKFALSLQTGIWPQDTCPKCGHGSGCCQSFGHHHLDMCCHCGNDERDPRVWSYRGVPPTRAR